MVTAQFERFIRPATAFPQIWRLVIGSILIVMGYFLGIAAIFLMIFLFSGAERTLEIARTIADASGEHETLLLLFSFVGALLAPMLVVRWLHKRAARTLFGPRAGVVRGFVQAAALIFGINIVVLLGWSMWFDATPNLPPARWMVLLPFVIAGLLIQTLAEEIIFRSYLPQQLAARFRSPFIWMLLPALAFGALHFDPASMGTNTLLTVGVTVLFALVATDLVRITGNLGAAWGFHFANNFVVIAILSTKGSITGVSLFVTPYTSHDTAIFPVLLMADSFVMLICWLILRRTLER